MDTFTKNPGLQHIAGEIFFNLDLESLEKCKDVNESWKMNIETPSFWLRKCLKSGFLMNNQASWEKAVRLSNEFDIEENMIQLLKGVCRWKDFDVSPILWAAHMGDSKIIEALAPLLK